MKKLEYKRIMMVKYYNWNNFNGTFAGRVTNIPPGMLNDQFDLSKKKLYLLNFQIRDGRSANILEDNRKRSIHSGVGTRSRFDEFGSKFEFFKVCDFKNEQKLINIF